MRVACIAQGCVVCVCMYVAQFRFHWYPNTNKGRNNDHMIRDLSYVEFVNELKAFVKIHHTSFHNKFITLFILELPYWKLLLSVKQLQVIYDITRLETPQKNATNLDVVWRLLSCICSVVTFPRKTSIYMCIFLLKTIYCGILDWCIIGFVWHVYQIC